MSNKFSLNGWLRRQPQPVAVIVERDGKPDQKVEVGKDGRNWKNLQQTLQGLAPYVRLTLLNGQGEVIRAHAFDEEASEAAGEESKSEGQSEIEVFARLLTEATKDQPILKHAMEFIATLGSTTQHLTRECEQLRAENAKLRLVIGELQMVPAIEEGSGAEGALGALVPLLSKLAAGMQAGQVAPKPKIVPAPTAKEGVK